MEKQRKIDKTMKIAKIISTKQVVINAGSKDGLVEGDKLEIIDKIGSEHIKDPDTGEDLGQLDVSKGIVYVSKVYPKMAIADAPSKTVNPYTAQLTPFKSSEAILSGALGIMSKRIQEDLNVDPTEITGDLPKGDIDQIRIGDIVILRP